MRKIKLLVVLSIIACLVACASAPKPIDMSKLKENQISEINLSVEDEIQANFRQSNGAATGGVIAGGLIGAMIGAAIDSGINSKKKKKATQNLVEIKSSLSEFNFKNEIELRIPDELNATVFNENIKLNIIDKNSIPEEGFAITGNYQLSDNFAHLKVNLTTSLYGIKEKPTTRLYSVVKNIDGAKPEREENIQLIVDDNSAKLKSLIVHSIQEALTMINKDFSGDYNYTDNAEEISFTDGTYPLSGRFIEKNNSITIIGFSQAGINGIYSVPAEVITVKSS